MSAKPSPKQPLTSSSSATVAEGLRAHARLCRQIAEQSWSEETAARLGRLAEECARTAKKVDPAVDNRSIIPH